MHVDSHMDPNYESAEEMDDKKAGIYLPEMSDLCSVINIRMY